MTYCDEREAGCRCRQPEGHAGPHVCASPCGGSWTGSEAAGDFQAITFPGGVTDPFEALMGLPFMRPSPGLGVDEEW